VQPPGILGGEKRKRFGVPKGKKQSVNSREQNTVGTEQAGGIDGKGRGEICKKGNWGRTRGRGSGKGSTLPGGKCTVRRKVNCWSEFGKGDQGISHGCNADVAPKLNQEKSYGAHPRPEGKRNGGDLRSDPFTQGVLANELEYGGDEKNCKEKSKKQISIKKKRKRGNREIGGTFHGTGGKMGMAVDTIGEKQCAKIQDKGPDKDGSPDFGRKEDGRFNLGPI